MRIKSKLILATAAAVGLSFVSVKAFPVSAQEKLAAPTEASASPAAYRLTLEEAKQRVLSNNKLLNLASLNAESKAFAVRAARADYFPKVVGSVLYLHFNEDLGTVLTAGGRTV